MSDMEEQGSIQLLRRGSFLPLIPGSPAVQAWLLLNSPSSPTFKPSPSYFTRHLGLHISREMIRGSRLASRGKSKEKRHFATID